MKNELLAVYIAYMDKVLSNARVDYLRRLKRIHDHEILPGDVPDVKPIQDLHDFEIVSLEHLASDVSLQAALNLLSDKEAYVLLQLVCMECSATDVANDLGITLNSVSRMKRRILRKLRSVLVGGRADG